MTFFGVVSLALVCYIAGHIRGYHAGWWDRHRGRSCPCINKVDEGVSAVAADKASLKILSRW